MEPPDDSGYRLAIEAAPTALLLVDRKGTILVANAHAEAIFGYDRGELNGRPVDLLVPKYIRGAHPALRASFAAHPAPRGAAGHREVSGLKKDGTEIPVDVGLSSLEHPAGTLFLTSIVDLTARTRLQAALDASQERLTLMLAGSLDGVWDWDIASGLVFYSKRFTWLLGYDQDEFGEVLHAFEDHLHPDEASAVLDAIGAHLARRGPFDMELRLRTKRQGFRWFRCRAQAIWNDHGTPTRMAGAIGDITAQRTAEEEISRCTAALEHARHTEIQQAAELAALTGELRAVRAGAEATISATAGLLAAMSHEIRTPLNGVIGGLDLALAATSDVDRRDLTQFARTSAGALLAAVNDIVDYSRAMHGQLPLEIADFDPAPVVATACAVGAGAVTDRHLRVRQRIDASVPACVRGDARRLQQVIENLLSNAVRFTNASEVAVEARIVQVEDETLRLRVEIADASSGLSDDVQDALFHPFTITGTPRCRPDGTGLGLAICRGLVQAMDGQIGVRSSEDGGSLFWFEITVGRGAAAAPTLAPAPDRRRPLALSPSMRVLVVDDNHVNRLVLGRMIERTGATVGYAGNGVEALQALDVDRYDVVMMDQYMPEMDGLEATRRIRAQERDERRARVVVIGVTASGQAEDRVHCHEAGMDDFLSKPVSLGTLDATLAKWTVAAQPAD